MIEGELPLRWANSMTRAKLIVWYNTKCPVCNGGIERQNRRLVQAARAGAIEFRDINLEPNVLARFGAGNSTPSWPRRCGATMPTTAYRAMVDG